MHGPGRNVQRSIHVRLELKHKTFQAKHVKLFGELLSLRQRLPCFRGKLPSFAEIMSVRVAARAALLVCNEAPRHLSSGSALIWEYILD